MPRSSPTRSASSAAALSRSCQVPCPRMGTSRPVGPKRRVGIIARGSALRQLEAEALPRSRVGPLAALAWSRAARLAAVCGASYGCINGVVARTVMAPAEALVAMLVFGAIAFLIFWPLLALGFYCAWRWVGVEPLPLLYDPAARPPAWRLAL